MIKDIVLSFWLWIRGGPLQGHFKSFGCNGTFWIFLDGDGRDIIVKGSNVINGILI